MENNIDNEKSEAFVEILKNEDTFNSKVHLKTLFFTTDSWLAQLGARKNN